MSSQIFRFRDVYKRQGLLGLVASFHGILLVAGRTTMELGRAKYIHHRFARLHHSRHTPAAALVLNMLLGIAILLSGKTAEMIVLAAFGALTIYVFALVSQLILRRTQPELARPFKTPLYPVVPAVALVIAVFSIMAMAYFNMILFVVYVSILALGALYFYFVHAKNRDNSLI